MQDKKKRCQVNFDVSHEMRQDLKMRAIKRNISLNLWIMRAVVRAIAEEDKYKK